MSLPDLSSLDTLRLCREGVTLQSDLASALTAQTMTRLAAESQSNFVVDWQMAWSQEQLSLFAKTQLTVRCERCLQPMRLLLETSNTYAFVRDEATALAQDADSEVDLLVESKTFNALELMEDELLMAIPFNPMHDLDSPEGVNCQQHARSLLASADMPVKPDNPFEVLMALKLNKKPIA